MAEIDTGTLKRRLQILEEQCDVLCEKHKGKEETFAYQGGFDVGYLQGKIAILKFVLSLAKVI